MMDQQYHANNQESVAAINTNGGGEISPLLFLCQDNNGGMKLNTQIIVCDRITSNPQLKGHELGKVLNDITIPVLPYAVELNILLKIFDFPAGEALDTHFIFTNSRGEKIGQTGLTVLRNYRMEDQVPGVDKDFTVILVLTEPGIVHIRCLANGKEAAWYPLTIRLQDEEQHAS